MQLFRYIGLIFFISYSMAGTDGTVRGKVLNVEGESLPGAQVYIADLGVGTMTDVDGNYILLNLEVGTYDVTVSMIGFATQIIQAVDIVMDQTVWLNFSMQIEAIEGEVIHVSAQKELVEKGSTSKKITISKEAIEALPIRDVADLYSLQSGVVKVEAGTHGGIPDMEERGLEEVHVRGGRSGEIAYMIDGLYIRNPIFGGIGNGTRLNIFAIKEFDFQPGGFNAEYGDAMSAVSNMHTNRGGKEFQYKFKYETSLVGATLFDSRFDELRGYDDYSLGFGGKIPFTDKFNYWVSGQFTENDNSRVLEFDDITYIENDQGNDVNRENLTQPWDTEAGFRGFGFNNTWDVFGNLTFKATDKLKLNASYWRVAAHAKYFSPKYMFWDEGQQELFRDTERYTLEVNHSLTQKMFYTFRASQFIQDQFQGVRWQDSDDDELPDWFEWSYAAGERQNPSGVQISDPYNPDVVPYTVSEDGKSVYYTKRDGLGPAQWSSGWYKDAEPGNYNWEVAEDFNDVNYNGVRDGGESYTDELDGVFCGGDNQTPECGDLWEDLNGNGIYERNIDIFDPDVHDIVGNGQWNAPQLVAACEYRDGSYWLTPEMYVDSQDFMDSEVFWNEIVQNPSYEEYGASGIYANIDSLYFLDIFSLGEWADGRAFGGHDRFFHDSSVLTQEMRLDFTSQMTDKWKARVGVDLKSHKLNYYEVENPWEDVGALRQRFSEQWDDFGADGEYFLDSESGVSDDGEGNGQWDNGETFDDFNGNGKWDDFVEPMEVAGYFQNTFEVPWMVINAGVRFDGVNYNTKIWSDAVGDASPERPWFWSDCGLDGLCADSDFYPDSGADLGEGDGNYQSFGNGVWNFGELFTDELDGGLEPCSGPNQTDNCGDTWEDFDGDGIFDSNEVFNPEIHDLVGNGVWEEGEDFVDEGEEVSTQFGLSNAVVFFKNSEWLWKISPRIGFSHIITDQATFTFNYGVYYQTPTYANIYLNTNKQEDPEELFEDSSGQLGNATMTAARSQAYEFAFNFQIGNNWGFTVGAWLKDMDQMSTARTYRSGIYEYQIFSNGDYGNAKGLDLTIQNRGMFFTTMIQYTYSIAQANGEYDKAAFGNQWVDAPSQQFLMPFDRPHDLTISMYTYLPFGINASMTGFYESGVPYTPMIFNGDRPESDVRNKNTKRTDSYKSANISLSKHIKFSDYKLSLGLNVYNAFNISNALNIYELTGEADDPGEYYLKEVKLPIEGGALSGSYYDQPWRYSTPRNMNFFIRIDFN
ncbi:MAG: TonB-dependent receptor plug domain-containing protein [Candidatus Marinimicrobia bacterium]|nr:TonB-dependent receptor plug domain-containing protein [Candidatus Neomarinimicrobiota bacterium]